VSNLRPLLGRHPLWPNVAEWFSEGVSVLLRPITEADRRADISAMLERGNHKSAQSAEQALVAMLQEEVEQGWQLILPQEVALRIPDAVAAPLGFVIQDTINERGEITEKQRLTHDQSLNPVPGTLRSVNDRLQRGELTPCRYGSALRRYIHFIVQLRLHHPQERILQTKVDWKAAYRRLHLAAALVVQSCVFIAGYLLLALRLTFGGAANPSRWCDVSELSCNLANDLLRNPGWDPEKYQSPHQHLIGEAVEHEPDDIPLAPAESFSVDLPREVHCGSYPG
jgi:hypothetical protein